MMKYSKEELYKMSAIEVYNMVIRGDILKKFPDGFWKQPEARENALTCARYLIEDMLKLSDDELRASLSKQLFKKNKLGGMIDICFGGSPFEIIKALYGDKFNAWEFKCVPNAFWSNIENGILATKWLIEKKLKLGDDQLRQQLSTDLFERNGLSGMLQHCFNSSPFEAINSAYPGKYKIWEFSIVTKHFWDDRKNCTDAVRWLIEDKLKLNDSQIKEKLSRKLFIENNLQGMINIGFNGSPFEAINATYEGKFKEWEFNMVPLNFWDDTDNIIAATKWLVEEVLQLDETMLKEQLSYKMFKENGLGGMLNSRFNNSPFEPINITYPNKYKKEDFKGYINRRWYKSAS